jgi:hypothetical protein
MPRVGEFLVVYSDNRGRKNRKRPLQDPNQYYTYVWRYEGKVIYVGQGHNNRGRPSKCNIVGRPQLLAELLSTQWHRITYDIFPCQSQQEAREMEIKLTLELQPQFNVALGFAGFASHNHSKESRCKIGNSLKGHIVSDLCRQKARERAIERNKTNPPRRGKKNSLDHNRKISEAKTGIKLSSSHKESLRLAALKRNRSSTGQFEGD